MTGEQVLVVVLSVASTLSVGLSVDRAARAGLPRRVWLGVPGYGLVMYVATTAVAVVARWRAATGVGAP